AGELAVGGHSLDVSAGAREWHGDDVCGMKRNHLAMLAAHERAHSTRTVVGRKHPIKRVRRAAALEMAEHDAARLFAGQALKRVRDAIADAAQTRRMFAVAGVLINLQPTRFFRALRRDDDAELRI